MVRWRMLLSVVERHGKWQKKEKRLFRVRVRFVVFCSLFLGMIKCKCVVLFIVKRNDEIM